MPNTKNSLQALSAAMKTGSDDDVVNELFAFMETKGQGNYGEPGVTQAQHALQSASIASERGLTPAEITAAIFHDIGHLLTDESISEDEFQTVDRYHERIGCKILSRRFGEDVTQPIRLHVNAKKYLCAVDGSYYETLSEASKTSLHLQGGPCSEEEVREFESNKFYKSAVTLRRIDDLAKVPNLESPGFETYQDVVKQALVNKVA